MTQYIIHLPLGIQLLGLLFVVLNDKYINKEQRKIMLVIISFVSLLVIQNIVENILGTSVSLPFLRTVFSILGYAIRPTIIVLFCKLVMPQKKHRLAWILVILNACVYSTALFSHIVFFISENNHFFRGSILSYTAYFVSAVLIIYLVYCTISEYKRKKSSLWIAFANATIIILTSVFDMTPLYREYPVTYLTIAVVSCSLFYYIWLHLEFVYEHENALKATQRIQIMMSQIQPHFLYNTLSTIQALCLMNPKKAAEVTERFGTYLRNNMGFLDQPNLILLSKELEHTRIYSEIEMLRFPKISVEYDIKTEDFYIPALTIQPLVENAIRHGVRSREQGLVTVATRASADYFEIIISDNGVGFNPKDFSNDESKHIGIANVKERVESMCGGTLTIKSEPDNGTTVTIKMPRRTV